MKLVARTDIGNQRVENQDSYRAGRLPGGTVWAVVCDGMGGKKGSDKRMKLVARTDIGNQRVENQDSYRAGRLPGGTVWAVVCDGMGGARGGRLASSMAAAGLEEAFSAGISAVGSSADASAFLRAAIGYTNAAVYNKAQTTPAARGMGTTVVCAIARKDHLQYAHVGDSRAYLMHNGGLFQLTKDHSMVQELVEQGTITEEESYTHPQKNLITRALGVGRTVAVDCGEVELSQGDIVLLCTDGLSNYVSAEEIAGVLARTPFYEAADKLVDKALEAGGLDNITVLLIGVEEEPEEEN